MAEPSGEPGVFSRNHLAYLRQAAAIARRRPAKLVTFRSHLPWAEAARLVAQLGPRPIFFAENDGDGAVTYRARLRELVIAPRKRDADALRLLEARLEDTKDESGWEWGRGTLYAISHCERLATAFPQSRLLKVNNGLPIDAHYTRGYVLVHAPDDSDARDDLVADDIAAPPGRYLSKVQRIVRDGALARRLKLLHANRCQLCGTTVRLVDGTTYSEGHHLRPLGGKHRGPDVAANILVLCPNCHAMCDLAGHTIAARELRTTRGHAVAAEYLAYHNALVSTRRAAE